MGVECWSRVAEIRIEGSRDVDLFRVRIFVQSDFLGNDLI